MNSSQDSRDKFDWNLYLESQHLEAAPNFAFQHVDQCQQSLLEVGMVVEVQTSQRPRFWLATVTMKCGPFLRLKHVGCEDSTKEIWTDLSSVEIHPVGYSSSRGWSLEPPSYLKPFKSGAIVSLLEEHKAADCDASLLSPVQQMKAGITVEVEDLYEPRVVWPATIVRNVGGRLLLKYALPASSSLQASAHSDWLFCLSPRLHWRGWAASQSPAWSYSPPVTIRSSLEDNWSTMSDEFRAVTDKPWQFQQEVPSHCCNVGDRIRSLDPSKPTELLPATVIEVIDSKRLLIRFDSEPVQDGEAEAPAARQCVCFAASVFRIETDESAPTNGGEDDSGFAPGMALEAVNPWNPVDICVGVVSSVDQAGALLRIRLEKPEPDGHPSEFLAPVGSQDLFPVGWCDDSSCPLLGPHVVAPTSTEHNPQQPETGETEEKNGASSTAEQATDSSEATIAVTSSLSSSSTTTTTTTTTSGTTSNAGGSISYWCPKIYFNYRCFTGPLLSRIRVAALPRSVGPGPINLMMKEVLSLLLNGAYKPGSVLKQLQGEPGDPLPPGTQLEPLKAKYRQTTYRGTVPMASTAADVPDYCRWVCDKLQCCPYLFAPELVGDPCPHRCCILAKAVWQHKKKAPNWRHRRFVDILKSLPGLDPTATAELNNSANKSGPASLTAMESVEHSDEEDSDPAADQSQLHPQQGSHDHEEPAAKRRRGRPRKSVMPAMTTSNNVNTEDDRRGRHRRHHNHVETDAGGGFRLKLPALRPLVLDKEPSLESWQADDVWRFLQSTDCQPLADRLLQFEVDGPSLLLLQPSDIMDYVTLNWDLALRLCHLIGCLRLTYCGTSNNSTSNGDRLAKSSPRPTTAQAT